MKICVIDIGTNSIHMILTQIHSNGTFSVIAREKEMIRLGDHALVKGYLDQEVMITAGQTLKRFVDLARNRTDQILAVATSAVRESSNGGEFLDYVFEHCGLKVQVITGQEEARLIYLAVKHAVDMSNGHHLIVDIGGGSTEFIYTQNGDKKWMASVKIGSNRLFQQFPLSDPPVKSELKKLEKHIETVLEPTIEKIKSFVPLQAVIGTSGTMNTLVKVIHSQKSGVAESESLSTQKTCGAKEIEILYDVIKDTTLKEREKIRELDKKRANMFIHGIAIVQTLMKQLKVSSLISCESALREGLLIDFIDKNRKQLQLEEQFKNVRLRSVRALLDRYPMLKEHTLHVGKLALQIFDQLKSLHKLSDADRELLEYGAYLHDVGYAINFKRHHKHSYYIITNSDLPGFELNEIQTIAILARFHRKSLDKKSFEQVDVVGQDMSRLTMLAGILRLADALDRSHFAVVQSVKIDIRDKKLKFILDVSADAQCEIYEAKKRDDVLSKALKVSFEYKLAGES